MLRHCSAFNTGSLAFAMDCKIRIFVHVEVDADNFKKGLIASENFHDGCNLRLIQEASLHFSAIFR